MCAGNYAEEILAADAHGRPGFLLDKGGSFAASTTTRDAFRADGKTGEALAANARRDDIFCEPKGWEQQQGTAVQGLQATMVAAILNAGGGLRDLDLRQSRGMWAAPEAEQADACCEPSRT